MIPQQIQAKSIEIAQDLIEDKTFRINFDKNCIEGKIDQLKAVEQTIYMTLMTERYAHIIFTWQYGIGIEKYLGQDVNFIMGDLPREIKEALMLDNRITDVHSFRFEHELDMLKIWFTVDTVFGGLQIGVVANGKNIRANIG